MNFTDIRWMGDFPEGDFLLGIGDNMIAVAPEVTDLCFQRLMEMNQDAQPGLLISSGFLSFIEAVSGDGGFEVIFSDLGQDRTRIQGQVFPKDDFFIKKSLDQKDAEVL